MQLSAANLLIASQQIARGAARVPPEAQAQFTAALAKAKGPEAAGFEPMDFKQAAPAPQPAAASATPPAAYSAGSAIGGLLDIKV